MKKILSYLCFVALLAMTFTSCSKDEQPLPGDDAEKASLSFGAIVEDIASKSTTKQTDTGDLPQCSNDAPAYVEIVLSSGGTDVVGSTENPFRIDLVAGQVFTEEVPELELEPGRYSLDHFMVYNSEGDLLWIAPTGGVLAQFIDSPLPMNIDLGAGVKKYVDVSVLCYDDRDVREYGYMFFDVDTNEAIEFCIFGNYCVESGRHYPARFSVDVWTWNDGQRGTQLHDDVFNTVTMNEYGDYAATPACLALPDLEGDDQYYFEITLQDSDAYGNIEERIIRSGVITDTEVRNFFDGEDNLDYYHFREGEGCTNEDTPPVFNEPGDDALTYKACLLQTNDSGALALAYFRLSGDQLQTTVLATGLEPNQEHPQNVFGKSGNATCAPESAAGEDGVLSLEEGAAYYGDVMLALTDTNGDFPTADANGNYIFERTFTLGQGDLISAAELGALENRVAMVQGVDVDGTYMASAPAACAEIIKQE